MALTVGGITFPTLAINWRAIVFSTNCQKRKNEEMYCSSSSHSSSQLSVKIGNYERNSVAMPVKMSIRHTFNFAMYNPNTTINHSAKILFLLTTNKQNVKHQFRQRAKLPI